MAYYFPKNISEVKSNDSKVSMIGTVDSVGENSFVLDDGTGKIEIGSDIPVERKKFVRVFCTIADEKLRADIVQDTEGLDVELLKKVNSLYNSAGV